MAVSREESLKIRFIFKTIAATGKVLAPRQGQIGYTLTSFLLIKWARVAQATRNPGPLEASKSEPKMVLGQGSILLLRF